MSLTDDLQRFYRDNGFGEEIGRRRLTVPVYTGCLLVPLPNIETRHRYLKYHDLHHLITGYSTGRIGEGEVSAWELGSGSIRQSRLLAVMNLIALSTGMFLEPRRMWRGFESGCRSRNLYAADVRREVDAGRWNDIESLRTDMLERFPNRRPGVLRRAEFAIYVAAAIAIHLMIALPAVVTRFVTDLSLGMNLFQAARPSKRTDLY